MFASPDHYISLFSLKNQGLEKCDYIKIYPLLCQVTSQKGVKSEVEIFRLTIHFLDFKME